MKTRHLSLVTSTPSVTTTVKSNVLSPFGPVRAGLTTSQITQDQQLSELLNSLESKVENLVSKSFTLYDTLNIAIEGVRVALSSTLTEPDGIDNER